ncbi:hypothetical protein AB1Y20_021522 [Prymnesium parvum]|uniref:PH domain-containing protein n=1 Tax=Prymnesium parvum TaxID=97485 RepID=A0AB34JIX1_PRYPA
MLRLFARLSGSRHSTRSSFDHALHDGSFSSSPVLLAGPMSYRGVAGTAEFRGGYLSFSPEGGKATGIRVSELSVVVDASADGRSILCVATSAAPVEELHFASEAELRYWREGLQAYVRSLGGEPEVDEREAGGGGALAEGTAEGAPRGGEGDVYLKGQLWRLDDETGWQLGSCVFSAGELSHFPYEVHVAAATIRLSELSLVEGITPLRFCIATGSAYLTEFEAASEAEAQYWIHGLRAHTGQSKAQTVHGYVTDAVLLSFRSSENLEQEGADEGGKRPSLGDIAEEAPFHPPAESPPLGEGHSDEQVFTAAEFPDDPEDRRLHDGPNSLRVSMSSEGALLTKPRALSGDL